MHSPQAIYFFFKRHVSVSLVCDQLGRQDVTWKPAISEFRFLPNSVLNLTNHVLLDRCGEAIVVLNEGFLHINQAAHLAKVSATYLRLISFVSLVIFKETNK